jgi:hypothetical protein
MDFQCTQQQKQQHKNKKTILEIGIANCCALVKYQNLLMPLPLVYKFCVAKVGECVYITGDDP